MADWGKELLDPKKSGVAALKLEGLGPSAAETLQAGLKSDDAQVRFFAAESLAYLDDPSGTDALAETAVKVPQFRAYAVAALAAMDQNAARMKLRRLMDEPDIEIRYGAFNALRTLDPHEPLLGRVRVLDDPKSDQEEPEESPDSMAIALAAASQRPRADDPFALYLVDSEGPPVVHISRTRRSEVVVFGRTQKLQTPVVLGSGAILLNAADKDDEIEISKIVPSKFGDSDVKLRTSLDLGEVIRRVANLGASYPEIVAILEAANRQKNLPGTLVVDAVPKSNADYLAAAILGKSPGSKVDASVKRASAQSSLRFRRLFGMRSREKPERRRPPTATEGQGSDTRPRTRTPIRADRPQEGRRTFSGPEADGPATTRGDAARPPHPGHACWTGSCSEGLTDLLDAPTCCTRPAHRPSPGQSLSDRKGGPFEKLVQSATSYPSLLFRPAACQALQAASVIRTGDRSDSNKAGGKHPALPRLPISGPETDFGNRSCRNSPSHDASLFAGRAFTTRPGPRTGPCGGTTPDPS